jgi:RNA polymerase sigma-70 factor (ECF subfamily)
MVGRRARADEFRAFYRAHYGVILTVAEQRLDTRQAAEDATADVFQIAWRRFRDEGAALSLPWAYQILRNVVGTEYRRRERARRALDRLADEQADPPEDDQRIDVRDALGQLPERERELLFMAYWEDLTHDEIAQILGITHGALRVRLTRARARLRAALEPAATGEHDG